MNPALYKMVNEEIMPGTGVNADRFWEATSSLVTELAPRNAELLRKRNELQEKIDRFVVERKDGAFDFAEYKGFLKVPEPRSPCLPPLAAHRAEHRLLAASWRSLQHQLRGHRHGGELHAWAPARGAH